MDENDSDVQERDSSAGDEETDSSSINKESGLLISDLEKEWFKGFSEGIEQIENEPGSGRPATARTDKDVFRIRDLVRSDRRLILFMFHLAVNKLSHVKGLVLYELVDLVAEDDSTPPTVLICPGEKLLHADTDKGSNLSDKEALFKVDHFPSPILHFQVIVRYEEDADMNNVGDPLQQCVDPQPCTSTSSMSKGTPLSWKTDFIDFISKIPNIDFEF
ncbi:hypothetical protein ILUMI_22177 [Ignelater luminosus]|uniref:Uncharacterized protein n=1 Tax=Ignelater luminosus TaxID=2038154 RepID=A0A8K0CB38_IGNLU|nr:hypothetical protein ILUMI_22177 [Ignelater luminosus]